MGNAAFHCLDEGFFYAQISALGSDGSAIACGTDGGELRRMQRSTCRGGDVLHRFCRILSYSFSTSFLFLIASCYY